MESAELEVQPPSSVGPDEGPVMLQDMLYHHLFSGVQNGR